MMEARAGVSVVLSLCIVALTTVALYRPERPIRTPQLSTQPDVAAASAVEPPEPAPPVVPDLPEPTAGIPLPTPERAVARSVAVPVPKARNRPASEVENVSRRRPTSAFTSIAPGETLVDIATRIYGTPTASDSLFRANRDVLNAPDDPLQVGGMLRTP